MRPACALAAALASTVATFGFVSVNAPPALAEHCYEVEQSHMSHGHIITTLVLVCPEHTAPVGQEPDDDVAIPPPAGSAACIAAAVLLGLPPDQVCGGGSDDPVPVLTGGMVAEAFMRLPLSSSELVVQPPGGLTLVNFATNFFTTNDRPFTRTIRLLGRSIQLRIWPTSYTWNFGTGDSMTTSSPGARYPKLEVTHNYRKTGRYTPSVDTTYAAEWRVGGSRWQPVLGTATIAGTAVPLRAIEATPTLVGYGG